MMTQRAALCVGINQFKNYPTSNLQGCVNDANDMAEVLTEYLGFTTGEITKLVDDKATKANILDELNKMVTGAKKGLLKHLVFSFSSHGTQVPDASGDEFSDNCDEAFCPHDLIAAGDQWDPAHIITDDELHDLFVQLPNDVLLEVFLDTCHSGTGLKPIDFLLTRRPRYMPPPSAIAFQRLEECQSTTMSSKMREKGLTHHILWAACKSNQTSADAKIGNDWHGAFTYYFVKEMKATQNTVPRKEILKRVRKDLRDEHYDQVPQLEAQATVRTLT